MKQETTSRLLFGGEKICCVYCCRPCGLFASALVRCSMCCLWSCAVPQHPAGIIPPTQLSPQCVIKIDVSSFHQPKHLSQPRSRNAVVVVFGSSQPNIQPNIQPATQSVSQSYYQIARLQLVCREQIECVQAQSRCGQHAQCRPTHWPKKKGTQINRTLQNSLLIITSVE